MKRKPNQVPKIKSIGLNGEDEMNMGDMGESIIKISAASTYGTILPYTLTCDDNRIGNLFKPFLISPFSNKCYFRFMVNKNMIGKYTILPDPTSCVTSIINEINSRLFSVTFIPEV